MKRLIGLVCIVACAGCTSSSTPEHLRVRVESFARSESRLEGTYVLLPSKESEEHPKAELVQIVAFIDHALSDRGLRKVENQGVADFAVFAHFGVTARPVTLSRDELIFSQRVAMPPFGQGPASIRYEPVGYMAHESTRMEKRWFLVLTVYDLKAFRSTGETRVMWEIATSCGIRGLSIVRAIPALLSASIDRFASNIEPIDASLVSVGPDEWRVHSTAKLPTITKDEKAAQQGATDNSDD